MSRDRARVRFKTTLDPGLLLFTKQVGEAATTKTNGKGKARAVGGGDGSSNSRSRMRKPMTRVNSLVLSTDSPTLTRVREQPADSSKGEGSTLMSTIGSFGSRKDVASQRKYSQRGEREETGGSGLLLMRGKRRQTEQDNASSTYVSRRKRDDRRVSEPPGDAVLPPITMMSEPPSIGTEDADEEWDKIWQRWNTQTDAVRLLQAGKNTMVGLQDVVVEEEAENSLLSSQHSLLSIHSQDGQFMSTWSIHEQLCPAKEPDSLHHTEESMEVPDDSRSRMDEGLLLDSEFESSIEEDEEDEQLQHRLDLICSAVPDQMQRVRHVIFQGDDLQAHFSPAWDGFQLIRPPPSRTDVVKWAADKTSEGSLYDYEDMDQVPQWQDEAEYIL